MFRNSKIKIVSSIMGILLFVFIGSISLIYSFSYYDVMKQDKEMLQLYANAYWEKGNPSENEKTLKNGVPLKNGQADLQGPGNKRLYNLSTFHAIVFSEEGKVADVDNRNNSEVTDQQLEEMAGKLLLKDKTYGVDGSWVFYKEKNQGQTLVVFMDNTVLSGTIGTLFRYSAVFGLMAVIIFFFIARYLANRIVKPLEEMYKRQRQFVSDASHELKTPLAVLKTNLEMEVKERGTSKWLDNIKYETNRMSDLVHQLLELVRTEEVALPKSRVNFSRILQGTILAVECVAYEKNIRIKSEIEDGLFLVGDEKKLESAVLTLVDNALEYAPEKSEILINARRRHGRILFMVQNDGEEIPKEHRTELFERFYRADYARTESEKHYGLGLAIAKAIVTKHDGNIEVECEDGKVSFLVSLPASL